MADREPSDRVIITAASVADDVGFVGLRDLTEAVEQAGARDSYRVIGGHMVGLHVKRWGLTLVRETQDSDLGVPSLILRDDRIVEALEGRGYQRMAGNRWKRVLLDVPVDVQGGTAPQEVEAIIDILVPAYTNRPRQSVTFGSVTTIEVPGLADALNEPGIEVGLQMRRLNGQVLASNVVVPNERCALVLKALAWRERRAAKDAIDCWRCLEIAGAARLTSAEFSTTDSAEALSELATAFATPNTDAMQALASSRGLGDKAREQTHTRIRALLSRLGP